MSEHAANDAVRSVINELSVEPIPIDEGSLPRFAREQLSRAKESAVSVRIEELRSRMQRLEGGDQGEYSTVFAELVTLEQERRQLREQAYGTD